MLFCVRCTEFGIEKVFIAVGLSDGSRTDQTMLQVSLEQSSRLKTIAGPRTELEDGVAACSVGNTLCLLGTGPAYNELWQWSPTSGWVKLNNMASGRRFHCAAAHVSTLYALGGCTVASKLSTADTMATSIMGYNTSRSSSAPEAVGRWLVAGDINRRVKCAACVTYNNWIYMFGGLDKDDRAVAHVQMYSATQQTCTLAGSMPRALAHMSVALCGPTAILLARSTCLLYNLDTDAWQERDAFKADVVKFGLVVDGGALYVAGGGTCKQDKDGRDVWTCTDEVKSVAVEDVVEEGRDAAWRHHAKLPRTALLHACTATPLALIWDKGWSRQAGALAGAVAGRLPAIFKSIKL